MKKILSLLLALLAVSQMWAGTYYLMQNNHTSNDKGTMIMQCPESSSPYTAEWTCTTPGTYYFYITSDPGAEAKTSCDYQNNGKTFTDGEQVQVYKYGTSNYQHSITLNAEETGVYKFRFTDSNPYYITCSFPGGATLAEGDLLSILKGEKVESYYVNGFNGSVLYMGTAGQANDILNNAALSSSRATFVQEENSAQAKYIAVCVTPARYFISNSATWNGVRMAANPVAGNAYILGKLTAFGGDGSANHIDVLPSLSTPTWTVSSSTITEGDASCTIAATIPMKSVASFTNTIKYYIQKGGNYQEINLNQLEDLAAGTYSIWAIGTDGNIRVRSTNAATLTVTAEAPQSTTVDLAGSFNSWGARSAFTETATGVYSLTKEFEIGTYQIKLVEGGNTWYGASSCTISRQDNTNKDLSTPGNNITFQADQPGEYIFTYTLATHQLSVTYPEPTSPEVTLYFVNKDDWTTVQAHMWDGTASGTNWPGLAMTNTGEQVGEKDIYSVSFFEGAYTKIIFNNKENNVGVQTADLTIDLATPYYYDGSWYADVAAVETAMADQLKTNIYLAGTFNSWSTSSHNFRFNNVGDEIGYCTIANITSAEEIQFKIVENSQWCNAETEFITHESTSLTFLTDNISGYQVVMTPYAAGDYVVAFNTTTRELTVTYPEGEPMVITYHVELAGSFNDWGDRGVFTETATEGVFSLTKSFEKGEYQLKVVENSSWRGADYIIKRDSCSDIELNSTASGVNVTLLADKSGDYTFTYNVADHTLSVTYPTLENHTAYFINTTGFEEVYAYVYNSPSWAYYVEWPGELATKTGDKKYGYDVYSYTFPETYNAVIFNKGNSDSQVEFAFDPEKPYFTEAGAVAELNDVVAKEVTISAYQYSTLYSDKALRIPTEVTVEYVSAVDGNTLVTEILTDIIPANTGVMISGPANATFTFVEGKSVEPIEVNLLKGTTTDTEINNGLVHYILSLDENDVFGLYWPSGTDEGVGAFENQGGKAYLELPNGGAAPRRFVLRPNQVPTAVEPVETTIDAAKIIKNGQVLILRDGGAYNLLGVRIF